MRSRAQRGRATWMSGETANVAQRGLAVTAGWNGLTPATGQPEFRPGYSSRRLTFHEGSLLQLPVA
jgi:hypothetical protein